MINFKKIISFSLVFLMLFQVASFLNIGIFKSNQAYATVPEELEFFNGDHLPDGATLVGDWNKEKNYYWLNNAQGVHQMYFDGATKKMYVNPKSNLYAIIKIDPNNLPSEVMLQWHTSDGWEHRAYWGSNNINWGTDGQASRKNMSSQIPQAGQFVTLEIPAASVGLENSYVDGFALTLFNGRCAIKSALFDHPEYATVPGDHSEYIKIINKRSGKALDSYGNNNGDDVRQYSNWGGENQQWQISPADGFDLFDGNIPVGATQAGDWVKNNINGGYCLNNALGVHQMYFDSATNKMYVDESAILYAYIWIDPNNLPSEVMLQWHTSDGWEHRAYWGSNNINWGTDGQASRKNMSSQIPQAGQWIKLEIPATSVGLGNSYVDGFALTLFNGSCYIGSAGVFGHSQYAKIINKRSGKALDSCGLCDGDNVDQWDYYGGDNQKWQILFASGRYVKIINKSSGKALDSYGLSDGDDVRQWDYYGGDSQLWSLGDYSTSFSVIESSDPQYGFWSEGSWADSHMDSMKQLKLSIGDSLKGTIINGDLTTFGDQNDNLYKFKNKAGTLGMTVWPGLGNHDYQNNINDTFENNAAANMCSYIQDTVWSWYGYNSPFFDWKRNGLNSYHEGSLSYSWDVNGVHFVQLNNYATYESYFDQRSGAIAYDIKNSLDWLRGDLQNAGDKPVIINLHAIKDDADPRFKVGLFQLENLLKDFPHVSAIFCGHLHDNIAYNCSTGSIFNSIPIFYCGSAGAHKYLNVRFNVDLKRMYVDRINSTNTSIEGSEEFNLR